MNKAPTARASHRSTASSSSDQRVIASARYNRNNTPVTIAISAIDIENGGTPAAPRTSSTRSSCAGSRTSARSAADLAADPAQTLARVQRASSPSRAHRAIPHTCARRRVARASREDRATDRRTDRATPTSIMSDGIRARSAGAVARRAPAGIARPPARRVASECEHHRRPEIGPHSAATRPRWLHNAAARRRDADPHTAATAHPSGSRPRRRRQDTRAPARSRRSRPCSAPRWRAPTGTGSCDTTESTRATRSRAM